MEESTPKIMETSEDSGFLSMNLTQLDTTPLTHNTSTSSGISRKRKHIKSMLTPIEPEVALQSPFLPFSSTLNESYIKKFEDCVITPNFYVERDFNEKQRSEPKTPVKDAETAFYRTHSLNYQKCTPSKLNSLQKLGSPERCEILYPELKPQTPFKPHTTGRSSPAKKRLFERASFANKRRNYKKHDPLEFFINPNRNFAHVIEQIFTYLNAKELYVCKQVSKRWLRTIAHDKDANARVDLYVDKMRINKENHCSVTRYCDPCEVKDVGEKSDFQSFLKLGSTLSQDQRLNKCAQCKKAAIVDNHISQCQNALCGYIYCMLCQSYSFTGPENFTDNCQQAELVVKPATRRSFMDSPRKTEPGLLPSFLLNDSGVNSPTFLNEQSPARLQSSAGGKRRFSILGDLNREVATNRKSVSNLSPFVAVVPLIKRKQKIELIEPSSPPKVKDVVGSKKSKKNLKRLLINPIF